MNPFSPLGAPGPFFGSSPIKLEPKPMPWEEPLQVKGPALSPDQFGVGLPRVDLQIGEPKLPPLTADELRGTPPGGLGPRRVEASPKPQQKVESSPLGAAAKAEGGRALAMEAPLDPKHPYVATQASARDELKALGINGVSKDRIHVADLDSEHGGQVLRTAAGKTSLVRGAEVSLDYSSPDVAAVRRYATPEQAQRFEASQANRGPANNVGEVLDRAATAIELEPIERRARLGIINDEAAKANDGKKTFVNMSYNTSVEQAARGATVMLAQAQPGTEAHEQVVKVLGHEPRITRPFGGGVMLDKEDGEAIKKALVTPGLMERLERPESLARAAEARAGLEAEVARGREHGVMVFLSAGNTGDSAARDATVANSRSTADGVRGILTIGAADMGTVRKGDERVADFSSDGKIHVAAPGVRIPVGVGASADGKTIAQDVDGTSFASPYAAQTAALMASANPKLSIADLERLMADPRVALDLPNTTRDGAGLIDPINTALVARNPNITAAEIARLRASVQPRR